MVKLKDSRSNFILRPKYKPKHVFPSLLDANVCWLTVENQSRKYPR